MFPPRFHGTIFNVLYQSEPVQKTPIKAHVITSLESCEVISSDWKSLHAKFQPSDIERVENKKNIAVITMKPGGKIATIYLTTKPDPCDNLVTALTQVLALHTPEIRFLALTDIIPTFQFSDKSQGIALHKAIMDQTTQLLQIFSTPKSASSVNGSYVDVYSSLYRLRYSNRDAIPVETKARDVGSDIRRTMIVLWCNSLSKCLQPAENQAAKTFYTRVAVNAATTISKLGSSIGIKADDLVKAANLFSAQGDGSRIEPTALQVSMLAQTELNDSVGAVPAMDLLNMQFLLNVAVVALSGIVIGMYQTDIENLATRVVDFAKRVVDKRRVEDAKRDLMTVQTKFLRDMLCLLDGKRYDEPFQHIFCLWSLRELDSSADISKGLETRAFDPKAYDTKLG
jgi:hypothetical protein